MLPSSLESRDDQRNDPIASANYHMYARTLAFIHKLRKNIQMIMTTCDVNLSLLHLRIPLRLASVAL